ncbi:LytR/AlgR family response regulator transcription factor [Marinoscillum pacificum]|uniref:LytR/AlgR family response regulator transcription factor n=1 Tax=Marinoscillum pacificum TaxID=392723 RepID=UPI002157918C|nr:LytTR family DNA-binding domain-containing protein [Marinoscillum pacificum]
MIKYLIVDDEPIAHDIIEGYCEMLPNLKKVDDCYDALEALQVLQSKSVDLVFLDLNMPKLRGFDMLRTLKNPPKVIVTTAYQEYALEGFELDVVDYLLKPFDFGRFLKAINKVTNFTSKPNTSTEAGSRRIFVKSDKKHLQINVDEVLLLEAAGNYTTLVLETEKIMVREKISELMQTLDSDTFIQVHKSYVISVPHISSIEGNRIMIADHVVPVGQTFRNVLTELIKR